MGPQNAIIGEEYGTELPQVQLDYRDLTAERNAAKFSRTKEFTRLKEHLEARIEYYQRFLPDGRTVLEADLANLGQEWMVANAVVTEFRAVISFYEQASEVVKGT